jgi:hypothetical protein
MHGSTTESWAMVARDRAPPPPRSAESALERELCAGSAGLTDRRLRQRQRPSATDVRFDEMHRMMKRTAAAALALGLASATLNGCDEAEELLDCRQICEAQQECVDELYDDDACTDRCEQQSDADDDYRDSARLCEACIEERACLEQQTECAQYCSPIVL